MKITKDDVTSALDSFEKSYGETVSKASEQGLEQPEGADMGAPGEKMSDAAKAKKGAMMPPPMKKGHEEPDADDEGGESDHDEDDKPAFMKTKKAHKAQKSFAEDMPEEIQTKIDVSEFLKSLVDHTGECIDDLAKSVAKSEARISGQHGALVEAVEDIQKSQAKIGIVLKAICQRIGIIENAPAKSAKAETVAKSGAADRKFSSGLEGESQEPMFKSLSQNPTVAKSQLSGVLCDMVRKGEADAMDVIGFETNGFIRPELMPKLKTALN
jgi:flagellar hook-basal body complex protein FliE